MCSSIESGSSYNSLNALATSETSQVGKEQEPHLIEPNVDFWTLFVENNRDQRTAVESYLINRATPAQAQTWVSNAQKYWSSSHILIPLFEHSWFTLALAILNNPEKFGISIESLQALRFEPSDHDLLTHVLSDECPGDLEVKELIIRELMRHDVTPVFRFTNPETLDDFCLYLAVKQPDPEELILWLFDKIQSLNIELPAPVYSKLIESIYEKTEGIYWDIMNAILATHGNDYWDIIEKMLYAATLAGDIGIVRFLLGEGKVGAPLANNPLSGQLPPHPNWQTFLNNILYQYVNRNKKNIQSYHTDPFITQLMELGASFEWKGGEFELSALERLFFFNSFNFCYDDSPNADKESFWDDRFLEMSSVSFDIRDIANFFDFVYPHDSSTLLPEIKAALETAQACFQVMFEPQYAQPHIFQGMVVPQDAQEQIQNTLQERIQKLISEKYTVTIDAQGVRTINHRLGRFLAHCFTDIPRDPNSISCAQLRAHYYKKLSSYLLPLLNRQHQQCTATFAKIFPSNLLDTPEALRDPDLLKLIRSYAYGEVNDLQSVTAIASSASIVAVVGASAPRMQAAAHIAEEVGAAAVH